MRTRNVCALVAMGSAMATTVALGVRGERDASAAPQEQQAKPPPAGAAEMCPITQPAKLRMILRQLHALNQREIDAAKLAEARATSPQVKALASEMQRDHQVSDDELQELARKRRLNLTEAVPNDPVHAAEDAALEARLTTLKGQQGSAFDAVYLGPQPLVHELALQAIERGLALAAPKGAEHDLLERMKRNVTMHRDHALHLQSQLVLPPLGIGGGATGAHEATPEHHHGVATPPPRPPTGGGPSESAPGATKDAGGASAGDAQALPPEHTPPAPGHAEPPGVEDHVESPGD